MLLNSLNISNIKLATFELLKVLPLASIYLKEQKQALINLGCLDGFLSLYP